MRKPRGSRPRAVHQPTFAPLEIRLHWGTAVLNSWLSANPWISESLGIFCTNPAFSRPASAKELPIPIPGSIIFCPKRRKRKLFIQEFCHVVSCKKLREHVLRRWQQGFGSVSSLHGHKVGVKLMAVSGQCVLGLTWADQICIMYLLAFATLATGHPSLSASPRVFALLWVTQAQTPLPLGSTHPSDTWPSGSGAKSLQKLFPDFYKDTLQEYEVQVVSG